MDRQPTYEELEQRIRVLEAECAKGKEAEARYRNLFENTHEEIHVWRLVRDAQGQIQTWELVDANPPTLRTWGKTLADIQGKRPDDYFGPGITAHFMPVVQKIMAEGKPYSYEDYFPPLAKHFRFTSFPFGPDQFVTTGADITERKHAEEVLRTRERHHRLLIDNLHSGVVVHAPDTEILLANKQAGRMLGLSVDEMTGKTAADPAWVFVREDETPMPFDEYPVNRVLAERQPVRNLILGIDRPHAGDRVWVLVNAIPEFDGAGQLRQVVATFIDVTDRKRAEIALRESEARLQRVLDAANDGFWEWNVATGETMLSGRWAEMLGYDLADIEPTLHVWERLVHPDDLAGVWATVNPHLAGETPRFRTEYRMRAKNGEWRWISSRGKATARDAEGRPLRMSGTHTDVTEAKIAEQALRAALEEKTILMKEIHHRVTNNLQVLSSLLGLQADRTFVPEAAAVFRVMQGRIQSMGLLHETLYRSDSLARIGLPDYLESLCARLWDAVGPEAHHIALERQIDDVSLPLTQAVPCGLMVNELITNALKHAFPGGRDGRIRLTAKVRADREILLTVADDGVGLPPGVDPGRANTLGLQLVDILTQQLRGRLDVDREAGTGTAFHVAFPIKDA